MNFKGNLKYIITGSIIFLLIYMFVAAIPVGSDIYFEPVWTRTVSSPVDAGAAKTGTEAAYSGTAGLESFWLGTRFGYFTPDGDILHSGEIGDRVSVSPSAWATYPQDASNTVIHHPDGSQKAVIAAPGYVHLDDGRTYLFLPGGDAVSQYDDKGQLLWTREHTAPITAFNSSPRGTVIGYADGQLTGVSPTGSELFSFYPGGSDNPVILGAAISEDGTLVSCVCGTDSQRFLLIRISGGQYKVVYHAFLKGNLHRQAYTDFEQNGDYAFFEYSGGLGIMNCKKRSLNFVPFEGQIVATGECPGNALFTVLVKNGTNYSLVAIERPDHLVATVNFTADDAFLIQRGDALFLGMDDRISRINIRGIK